MGIVITISGIYSHFICFSELKVIVLLCWKSISYACFKFNGMIIGSKPLKDRRL
jgi:hypothetical protein